MSSSRRELVVPLDLPVPQVRNYSGVERGWERVDIVRANDYQWLRAALDRALALADVLSDVLGEDPRLPGIRQEIAVLTRQFSHVRPGDTLPLPGGCRIIASRKGRGFAYVYGDEYPVEAGTDGPFRTYSEALQAARDAESRANQDLALRQD